MAIQTYSICGSDLKQQPHLPGKSSEMRMENLWPSDRPGGTKPTIARRSGEATR